MWILYTITVMNNVERDEIVDVCRQCMHACEGKSGRGVLGPLVREDTSNSACHTILHDHDVYQTNRGDNAASMLLSPLLTLEVFRLRVNALLMSKARKYLSSMVSNLTACFIFSQRLKFSSSRVFQVFKFSGSQRLISQRSAMPRDSIFFLAAMVTILPCGLLSFVSASAAVMLSELMSIVSI